MTTLYDAWGQPIDLRKLREEQAGPTVVGVRTVDLLHPSRGLTPERIADILLAAETTDADDYLALAEDMEEKDLHYLSQLGTRKRAVAQLEVTVEAASTSADDRAAADLVREALQADWLEGALFDILDAVGKGFSVSEIEWDLSGATWMPVALHWRDPKWFRLDRHDGRTIRLRTLGPPTDLAPFKFVRHVHPAKSGLPLRGGLARAAAWVYLFKNFALKSWVQFAEIFGQPMRLGRYDAAASDADRLALLRAVRNIGRDAAAIVPEGMMIEFIEAQKASSSDLYQALCEYLDAQVSKAVVGQTLTADTAKGGGSRAQGDVHDRVRGDIRQADATLLQATLGRDLVRPIVDLNLGPRRQYPRVRLGVSNKLEPGDLVDALQKLVPLGLKVEQQVVRDRLGLPAPGAGADVELLQQPAAGAAPPGTALNRATVTRRSQHAAEAAAHGDAIDALVQQLIAEDGWRPALEPLVQPALDALDTAESVEQVREALVALFQQMAPAALAEQLARAGFVAALHGQAGTPTDA
jgi:phage gp29-like protein